MRRAEAISRRWPEARWSGMGIVGGFGVRRLFHIKRKVGI